MMTANKGESMAKEKGELNINGVDVGVLQIDNFAKTLISWSDLADKGITGTMEQNEIKLFKDDELWTTVHRQSDRLWHFTEAEQQYN